MKSEQTAFSPKRTAGSLLAWFLAMILALTPAFAGLASEEDDPIVVRVGAFSYPLSVVQSSLSSVLD